MIYQVVPEFYRYDAISQHARHIHGMLKDAGLPARLCARRVVPRSLAGEVQDVREAFEAVRETDTILFHFSIYSPLIDALRELPGRKVMIYHNITPARFFEGISKKTARACEKGRRQLEEAAGLFHLALGVSRFNEAELKAAGYHATGVLPLVVETNVRDDRSFRSLYYLNERITLLHVGKWAPNKKIEDIVKVFYCYHKIHPASRLVLVGRNWEWENYTVAVLDLIQRLRLQEDIEIIQGLPAPNLAALYRAADIYLSMSEHEGFCAPLIEAMASGCPVMAFSAGAVPETVRNAGILWEEKAFLGIAEGIHFLLRQKNLQGILRDRGKARAADFSVGAVTGHFKALLPEILGEGRA